MTEINYAAMSDQYLKRYVLTHRDDQKAFHAYMDRRHSRPRGVVVRFDDPDWENKIVGAIQTQLSSN
jgi:hypothetical protein